MPPKGSPGKRRDTATRDCGGILTALVPGTNFGFASENPTFFFYVPYQTSKVNSVEFFLKDNQGNKVYKPKFSLINTPGVISIRIPKSIALEEKKRYKWEFNLTINCAGEEKNVAVSGGVEKKSVDLKGVTELEQISFLAEQGIWFDSLAKLAQLYRKDPEDQKDNWIDLLQDVGLEEFASEKLVPCCNTE